MSTSREIVLMVGEMANIKRSFFGTSYSIIYAGMPNDSIYSVVVTSASGYHAIAYNLFLPAAQNSIQLPEDRLIIRKATAEALRFIVEH